MNTFLKVLLCVIAVLLALKFLPVLMGFVFLGALAALLTAALLLGGVGAGLLALLAVALVTVAVLAPIWIPVLVVIGMIALIRRCTTAKA